MIRYGERGRGGETVEGERDRVREPPTTLLSWTLSLLIVIVSLSSFDRNHNFSTVYVGRKPQEEIRNPKANIWGVVKHMPIWQNRPSKVYLPTPSTKEIIVAKDKRVKNFPNVDPPLTQFSPSSKIGTTAKPHIPLYLQIGDLNLFYSTTHHAERVPKTLSQINIVLYCVKIEKRKNKNFNPQLFCK